MTKCNVNVNIFKLNTRVVVCIAKVFRIFDAYCSKSKESVIFWFGFLLQCASVGFFNELKKQLLDSQKCVFVFFEFHVN